MTAYLLNPWRSHVRFSENVFFVVAKEVLVIEVHMFLFDPKKEFPACRIYLELFQLIIVYRACVYNIRSSLFVLRINKTSEILFSPI